MVTEGHHKRGGKSRATAGLWPKPPWLEFRRQDVGGEKKPRTLALQGVGSPGSLLEMQSLRPQAC